MQALKVGGLRLIPRLDERVKTGPDQLRYAATEDDLFAKEIRLSLFFKGGLDHAGPRAPDGLGIGEPEIARPAGRILMHREQPGDALTLDVHTAHEVPGALGRDHEDVDVCRRHDLVVMDVEAVGENQTLPFGELRRHLLVDSGLYMVGDEHHDEVGLSRSFTG